MSNSELQLSKTWVVVPAFNEDRVIRSVLEGLRNTGYSIAVVDDASSDSTKHEAVGLNTWVVSHPVNLGQGAALQTGITFALGRGAEHIVTFDSDGQHRVADIAVLFGAMTSRQLDVVCGSRFLGSASNMPFSRKMLLKSAILFQWITSGILLTDAHNGMRLLNRRAASVLDLRENRMAHASEILDQFMHHRLALGEAPVTIDYTEYSLAKGQSSGNAISIALSILARKLLP